MSLSHPPLAWQELLQQQLRPFLDIPDWGIGGSCLLRKLGLVTTHRDIDIVCSAVAFQQLQDRCSALGWEPLVIPSHPQLQSDHFARWRLTDGSVIEWMAGIKVVRDGVERRWCFSPHQLTVEQGLPWMRAADWLTLYQLFDRPTRVELIARYLDAVKGQSGPTANS